MVTLSSIASPLSSLINSLGVTGGNCVTSASGVGAVRGAPSSSQRSKSARRYPLSWYFVMGMSFLFCHTWRVVTEIPRRSAALALLMKYGESDMRASYTSTKENLQLLILGQKNLNVWGKIGKNATDAFQCSVPDVSFVISDQ
jgi:hypothetical protein